MQAPGKENLLYKSLLFCPVHQLETALQYNRCLLYTCVSFPWVLHTLCRFILNEVSLVYCFSFMFLTTPVTCLYTITNDTCNKVTVSTRCKLSEQSTRLWHKTLSYQQPPISWSQQMTPAWLIAVTPVRGASNATDNNHTVGPISKPLLIQGSSRHS